MTQASLADRELVEAVVSAMVDRKAEDIAVYDVSHLSTLSDWYVIANGAMPVHARAIAQALVQTLKQHHTYPVYREGVVDGRWAVLDYVDVVVHIMTPEMRDYYQIEELWRKGKRLTDQDLPVLAEAIYTQY